jgi:maleylpyruvate isomerase
MRLHSYFRSSAAWRVRIALALKGIEAAQTAHHLLKDEQHAPDYLRLNPQGQVPALELDDGRVLTQSLAIIEYLDETHPEPPLLPQDKFERARVRAFAQVIACDMHPVQNLRVLNRLRGMNHGKDDIIAWGQWVVQNGFTACEALLAGQPGPFCFGSAPTLADICLIPMLSNARRYRSDLAPYKRLLAAESACNALPAFQAAAPDAQPDAE